MTWDALGNGRPPLLTAGSTAYVYGPGGPPVEGTTATFLHQDQIGSTGLLTDAAGAVTARHGASSSPATPSPPSPAARTATPQATPLYYTDPSGLFCWSWSASCVLENVHDGAGVVGAGAGACTIFVNPLSPLCAGVALTAAP